MKIVKNYDDLGDQINLDSKKIIYAKVHSSKYQDRILPLLPINGKSVWIDSNGTDIDANIIAFEKYIWKGIFKSSSIRYYRNFFSNTLHHAIKKYIAPSSIVMSNTSELKYISCKELIRIINFLITAHTSKLIIHVNTVYLDFNKLKYSIDHVIENVKNNISKKTKLHKLDRVHYIFEID